MSLHSPIRSLLPRGGGGTSASVPQNELPTVAHLDLYKSILNSWEQRRLRILSCLMGKQGLVLDPPSHLPSSSMRIPPPLFPPATPLLWLQLLLVSSPMSLSCLFQRLNLSITHLPLLLQQRGFLLLRPLPLLLPYPRFPLSKAFLSFPS